MQKINAKQILLSVIVVSYNTAKLTKQCLESVIAETKSFKLLNKNTEIIVVDNASSDDSVKILNQLPIILIKNSSNIGFGPANNLAVKKASGEYLLFLNSDTLVKPGSISILLEALRSDQAAIDQIKLATATLYNADGSYQHQGGDLPNLPATLSQWLGFDDLPLIGKYFPSMQKKLLPNAINQCNNNLTIRGWVGGTALMIRSKDFLTLKGFDPNMFMYGEDMELCFRAYKLGWRSAIATKSNVTHLGSASSSSTNAKIGEAQAMLYIFKKHYPTWQYAIARIIIYLGAYLRQVLFRLRNDQFNASIYHKLLGKI